MRWRQLILAVAVCAMPVAAQTGPATPVPGAAGADAEATIQGLRARLAAAMAEIDRLRAAQVAGKEAEAARRACLAKNERLVGVGHELLVAYERRWRRSHHDPLQLTRRRFESEAQDYAGKLYEGRTDVSGDPADARKTETKNQ